MSGQTVTVYNQSGLRLLSYDNAMVDNDIDPPYAIIRDADTQKALALVPVGIFILEMTDPAVEVPYVPPPSSIGLDQLQAQEHMATPGRVPLIKFFGITPRVPHPD